QQPLVDNGPRGERRNVEEVLLPQVAPGDFDLRPLPDDIKLALERVLIHTQRAPDEDLLNVRLGAAGQATDGVRVDRRIAPAQDRKALLIDNLLDNALTKHSFLAGDGQEDHSDPVFAG